jgi:hypothetical protein
MSAFANVDASTNVPVTLIVTHYRPGGKVQESPVPHIMIDQLRAVHHILHGWDVSSPVLLITAANT